MATKRADIKLATAATPTPATGGGVDSLEIVVDRMLRQQDVKGGRSESMTIFRVPAYVRDANKELYEPRLVSIGPYYRGRPALRTMEQHKFRYLRDLLADHPGVSLGDCVRAVRNVELRASYCYSEKHVVRNSDAVAVFGGEDIDEDGEEESRAQRGVSAFAEMLLLDGCFILQFFIKWHNKEPDKLCDLGWGLNLLHYDLLLLENQIPFFVLEALFRVVAPRAEMSLGILNMILPHLRLSGPTLFNKPSLTVEQVADKKIEIHHLLHLFYVAFIPTARYNNNVTQPAPARARARPLVIQSATKLSEVGVRFKEKKCPRHMFEVTFDKAKGVMEIPRVELHESNKPLLVNLAAFEQTMDVGGTALMTITSYTSLMRLLLKTAKDVEELEKLGIIDNLLYNSSDAATKFFDNCGTLDYKEHFFNSTFADLQYYYNSKWNNYKAMFRRDYCSSPWAMIAVAVAAFVFFYGVLFKLGVDIYNLARHA